MPSTLTKEKKTKNEPVHFEELPKFQLEVTYVLHEQLISVFLFALAHTDNKYTFHIVVCNALAKIQFLQENEDNKSKSTWLL